MSETSQCEAMYQCIRSAMTANGRTIALSKFKSEDKKDQSKTTPEKIGEHWEAFLFARFLKDEIKASLDQDNREKFDTLIRNILGNYTLESMGDYLSTNKGISKDKGKSLFNDVARFLKKERPLLFLDFLKFCQGSVISSLYDAPEPYNEKRAQANQKEAIKKLDGIIEDISRELGIDPPVDNNHTEKTERYATITSEDNWLSPANESFIPFVGREKEIELLDQFANWKPKEGRNNFQIWAIVGPSGAGKTRLLTHWANREEMNGWKAIEVKLRRKAIDWDAIDCPTLISIDYLYGFDDVIADIISTAETTTFKHPVRLLLLDHSSPDNMYELINDPRWGVGDSKGVIEDRFIFQKAPMKLGVTSNSDADSSGDPADKDVELEELLTKIICSVAYRGKDDPYQYKDQPEIQQGLQYLKDTQGAQQPLFAALVGDAIKRKAQDGSSETSYLTLNRRELIAFYLKRRNALTFGGGNPKRDLLASCFIAAATVRRGAEFSVLAEAVPEKYESLIEDDFAAFKSLCNTITSNDDEYTLKAFEPDILGEAHFLLVLQSLAKEMPKLKNILYQQIASGVDEEGDDNVRSFIAFITRLTNNLSNDDQREQEVERSWSLLDTFLDQKKFSNNKALSWAVHMARAEVGFTLKEKHYHSLSGKYINSVDDKLILSIPDNIIRARYVGLCIRIYGLEDRYKTDPEPLNYLLNTWDQRSDRDWSSTMLAMWADNQPVIDYLMATASDHDVQYIDGWTALMLACTNQQKAAALVLIEKDANLNSVQKDGVTALMFALIFRQEAVALALIEKDANLSAVNEDGRTALMLACENQQEAAALALIEKDANLNAVNKNGWTALMVACERQQEAAALALIDKDANLDKVSKNSVTALMLACAHQQEAAALALIDKEASLNEVDKNGITALMLACDNQQEAVALALIEKEANLNAVNKYGMTALMYACHYKQEAAALALIEKDANLSADNEEGWTALMFACANQQEAAALALIDKEANLSAVNEDGWTALMFACRYEQETAALALIDEEANLDAVGKDGSTALRLACQYSSDALTTSLIHSDADLNVRSHSGNTVLMLAAIKNRYTIVDALIQGSVNMDIVFSNSDSSALDKIKSVPIDDITKVYEEISALSDGGLSELRSSNPSEVRELIIRVCQQETQFTALGLARFLGHTEIVKLLEEAGALELPPYNPEEDT